MNNNTKTHHLTPNWVRGSIITVAYGFSQDSIAKKRQRGQWQEGVIWTLAPDGRPMYSPTAIEEWIING